MNPLIYCCPCLLSDSCGLLFSYRSIMWICVVLVIMNYGNANARVPHTLLSIVIRQLRGWLHPSQSKPIDTNLQHSQLPDPTPAIPLGGAHMCVSHGMDLLFF